MQFVYNPFTNKLDAVGIEGSLPAVTTLDGNTGSATGSTITVTTGNSNIDGTALFTGSGSTLTLTFDDSNSNLGLGSTVLQSIGVGSNNTVLGSGSFPSFTYGVYNTSVGSVNNIFNINGNYNTLLGSDLGLNYTSSESSNILIGYSVLGNSGESNVLRIGNVSGTGNGNLNAAFIQGIYGQSGIQDQIVFIDSSGQLGSQGAPLAVNFGGTGHSSFSAYAVLCGGTTTTGALQQVSGVGMAGQVLTSNGAGALPTWQGSSSGVTSIAGTSNQISASASTGAVTLSLTNGISLGSYQATSPPTGGMLMPGQISIGSSSIGSTVRAQISGATTDTNCLTIAGTLNTINGSNNQQGNNVNATFQPTNGGNFSIGMSTSPVYISPSGKTITGCFGFYSNVNTASNVGTITNLAGFYADAGSSGAGTITNAYGGYFKNPGAGTHKCALYCDNFSVGYTGTAPPTNGLIVTGQSAFGTSSANSDGLITVAGSSTYSRMLYLTGTNSAVDGSNNQYGLQLIQTFNVTNGATNSISIGSQPTFTAPSAKTITDAFCVYTSPTVSSNVGTITNLVGVYADAGTSGAGTITNAYSGYFVEPASGTNRQALYAANLSVGVAASGTPTAGTIKTAPPDSGTVTSGFVTSLTAGTSQQNTIGYDILANISVVVSSATTATITLGVGSTSTPSVNTVVASFSAVAAVTYSFCAYIPNNYYVLVNTTGTISIGSITVQAMGI